MLDRHCLGGYIRSDMAKPSKRSPLYHYRKLHGLTSAEVAERLGFGSVVSVHRLETYERRPSLAVAAKIADLLGTTQQDVLRDYYGDEVSA